MSGTKNVLRVHVLLRCACTASAVLGLSAVAYAEPPNTTSDPTPTTDASSGPASGAAPSDPAAPDASTRPKEASGSSLSPEARAWEERHRRGTGVGLHGGPELAGSFRSLGSLPVHAYGVGLFFGGDALEHFGAYGEAGFELGESAHGLSTRFVRVGVRGEGIFDRFRLGGGPQLVYFGLRRVSNRQILDSYGLGLYLTGSVDVWQPWPHGGVFVGVRLDADAFAKILLAGATADVGFRF